MFVKFEARREVSLRRAHIADVGIDIFPGYDIVLEPHKTVKVGMGFAVHIPYNFVGYLKPRTSIATMGVNVASCPIDPGYTGEVFAILTNMNDEAVTIPANKAPCQLVIQPFASAELIAASDWIHLCGEKRMGNGFGSTDKD